MKTYVPREGSTAGRALEHLRVHGSMATSAIADALEVDASGFPASVEYAVRAGVIARTKKHGIAFWSVGDGKPLPRPVDGDSPPDFGQKPKLTSGVDIDKLFKRKPPGDDEADGLAEPPAPALVADTGAFDNPHASFRCALFSDGRFLLEFDGDPKLTLSVEQTRQLFRYLDCLPTREIE